MDEQNRVNFLRSLYTFSNEDDALLEQAAQKTFLKYFQKDTKVVVQGQSNRFIYWILSGEVQVNRTTPFIAKIDAKYPARYIVLNIYVCVLDQILAIIIFILEKKESKKLL